MLRNLSNRDNGIVSHRNLTIVAQEISTALDN
jgi:hypothetical protein